METLVDSDFYIPQRKDGGFLYVRVAISHPQKLLDYSALNP